MSDTTKTVLSVLGLSVLVVLVILLLKFGPNVGNNQQVSPDVPSTSSGTGNQSLYQKLAPIAGSLGVNQNQFLSCVASDQPEGVISKQVALGTELGVQGTPFFVVILDTNTAYAVPGALPQETFTKMLDSKVVPEGFKQLDQQSLGDVLLLLNDKDTATKKGNGGKYAGIKVVEFADIDCPFCQQIQPVIEGFVNQGADWTFLHYPLVSLHPNAHDKAIASVCVFNQKGSDGFFKFIDLLMI